MDNENSQTLPPDLTLTFGGRELRYLRPKSLDFEFSINRIPGGTVVLYRPDADVGDRSGEIADTGFCKPGAVIQIRAGLTKVLFTGRVVEQQLQWSQLGGLDVVLRFKHDLHQLTLVHRNQVFGGDKEVTDGEIVRAMLMQHNINITALSGMTVRHAQMVQYQCTDWCFLKSRLGANGVWLVPAVNGASVIEPRVSMPPTHVLDLSLDAKINDPIWVEEATWTFSAEDQAAGLKVSSWDVQLQKMALEANGRLLNPIGMNGLDPSTHDTLIGEPWELPHSVTMLPDEQTALANGRLLAQYGARVRGKFRVLGGSDYEIGQTLQITRVGGNFNGTGLITGVTQEMEQGIWRTTITLGHEMCCDLDDPVVPGISGLHVGVVAPHKPDLKSWNRLRVVVPALKLDDKPLWARFAAPYASKNSGVCFYPEPGDEVVLGFFENDPRYPVVLGAMHNPRNKAPFSPEQSLGRKGLIFSQTGQPQDNLTLLFKLTEKEMSLQSGMHQMSFDAKGVGLATDSAQPISFKSKAGIRLDGGTEVGIKGKKIDISN